MIFAPGRATPDVAYADRVLLGLAGCAWLAEIVLAPTTRGVGAAMSSHKLADLIGSGAVDGAVPRIVGTARYVTPLGAAIVLLTLGLSGSAARGARLAAALLAAIAAVAFAVFLARIHGVELGAGSWCGVAGAALAAGAIAIEGSTCMHLRKVERAL